MRFRPVHRRPWPDPRPGLRPLELAMDFFKPTTHAQLVAHFQDEERPGEVCPQDYTVAMWLVEALEAGFIEVVP